MIIEFKLAKFQTKWEYRIQRRLEEMAQSKVLEASMKMVIASCCRKSFLELPTLHLFPIDSMVQLHWIFSDFKKTSVRLLKSSWKCDKKYKQEAINSIGIIWRVAWLLCLLERMAKLFMEACVYTVFSSCSCISPHVQVL